MDLDRHAHDLRDLEAQLEARSRPVRDRYDRMGVAGLYHLAAAEQRLADTSGDHALRAVHLGAAMAAQALADDAVRRGVAG